MRILLGLLGLVTIMLLMQRCDILQPYNRAAPPAAEQGVPNGTRNQTSTTGL